MNTESPKRFFITHAHSDNSFAQRLADGLRRLGLEGFVDIYSIRPGDNIPARINKGLAECDVYVPILSNAALDSPWCEEEITAAIALSNIRDRHGRPRIIPALIENCQQRISQQYPTLLTRLYILFVDRYDDALHDLLVKGFDLSAHVRQNNLQEVTGNISTENKIVNSSQEQPISISRGLEVVFDREKYKDKYQGFRFSSLSSGRLERELRPMNLHDLIQRSIIYSPYNTPLFPPAEPIYSTERRLPIGIAFEREFEIGGSNISFSFFDLSANVFAVESLREDTGGPQFPKGSIGVFSCYRMIYAALLFGKRYYRALGFDGDFHIQFSLESSIPRSLVLDSRKYLPFHEQYTNDMSVPISVQKSISAKGPLKDIDSIASEMIREFCWYFHLDLSEQSAIAFLEKLKNEDIAIPKDVVQDD